VGAPPARAAEPAARCRSAGLVPSLDRCLPGAGEKGGSETGPNPTDRGKPGTKRHLVVEAHGIPLTERITPANRNEILFLEAMIDSIPPVRGKVGRPKSRPAKLHADKGYDFGVARRALRRRGIQPRIARRGVESSERLGRHRWVVERSFAWLNQMRRLIIRYERRADIHEAFLRLGCCLICFSFLERTFC
jgi:transposase